MTTTTTITTMLTTTKERNKTKRLTTDRRKSKSRQDVKEVARLGAQEHQQCHLIQNPVAKFVYPHNEQDESCSLIVDHTKPTEYGLDKVGHQLLHLLLAYNGRQPLDQLSEPYKLVKKFRTIMSLYWRILKIDSLYLSLKLPHNLSSENFNILKSRIEVLKHIESLEGYCDSINQLRLIVKSHSMIGVMTAYDKIIKITCETKTNNQLDDDVKPTNIFKLIERSV